MESLKKTFLFMLGFFYFPEITESLDKSVSLKRTISVSLLPKKKK